MESKFKVGDRVYFEYAGVEAGSIAAVTDDGRYIVRWSYGTLHLKRESDIYGLIPQKPKRWLWWT